MKMVDKIFDILIGFMLNRDLEREMGVCRKFLNGRFAEIPAKSIDRLVDFLMGARYAYYLEMRRNILEGGVVEVPSNLFDWKALERASTYLRVYMEEFHDRFKRDYEGNFPDEDFKDWFYRFHVERPQREATKKSVSEALLSDDLPRV